MQNTDGFAAGMAVGMVLVFAMVMIIVDFDQYHFADNVAEIICAEDYRFEDNHLYCFVDDDWIMWKPE